MPTRFEYAPVRRAAREAELEALGGALPVGEEPEVALLGAGQGFYQLKNRLRTLVGHRMK